MENMIPLESESKKKFDKTVKGIKKMLKNSEEKLVKTAKTKPHKFPQSDPISRDRGVVYVGHIPHGFYEDQMKSYFKQFGKVTNARVARSAKNGKSKGYAFVEFQNKEVAQIVAQTMNNYLMDKRLLKAEYVPPEKQRPNFFRGPTWIPNKKCPGITLRKKSVYAHNKNISNEKWIVEAKNQLTRLHKLKSKLRAEGIDYDFFQPNDIPEELIDFDPTKKQQKKNDTQKADKLENRTESQDKKNVQSKRKEKSMNKPVSPIAKPPKKKKLAENSPAGKFVRPPIESPKMIAEKKNKKNKQVSERPAGPIQVKENSQKKSKKGQFVRPLMAINLDKVPEKTKKNKKATNSEVVPHKVKKVSVLEVNEGIMSKKKNKKSKSSA